MSGRKEARGEAALRKRFEAEEQQAIDAVARWVGHPAVRGVIERRRTGAETVVIPIERMLTNQVQVIRFCWHVFGLAGIEPGWELRNGKPWMLTASEMNAIDRVEADLQAVVQMTVEELAAAGVGLVPSWAGDHVVVAELLLLDVTWDLAFIAWLIHNIVIAWIRRTTAAEMTTDQAAATGRRSFQQVDNVNPVENHQRRKTV